MTAWLYRFISVCYVVFCNGVKENFSKEKLSCWACCYGQMAVMATKIPTDIYEQEDHLIKCDRIPFIWYPFFMHYKKNFILCTPK